MKINKIEVVEGYFWKGDKDEAGTRKDSCCFQRSQILPGPSRSSVEEGREV
jgi:hypothetical protein